MSYFVKVNRHLALAAVPVGAEQDRKGTALAKALAFCIDYGTFPSA
jgi:hypothetical protein